MSFHELRTARSRLVVSTEGASLNRLDLDGMTVIPAYPAGPPPLSAGVMLLPWANRIAGGKWSLDGVVQQLEITEPARGHAIHGLVAKAEFEVGRQDDDAIELFVDAGPAAGYPFALRTRVRYALEASGLVATHSVTNLSDGRAPVVLGIHPYFRIGDHSIAEHTLTVAAQTEITLDDRYIPADERAVEGRSDFRSGRVLDSPDVHYALTGLSPHDGIVEHRLAVQGGPTVTVWADQAFGYVQLFLADMFPLEGGGTTEAIAIEPMTGPPNALASGDGLIWIDPGETLVARWGVSLTT